MRSIAFFATAGLLTTVFASAPAAESLLIPADRIYTAPDAPPLSNGNVLISDGRITAVADERGRLAIPADTRTSQCRGVVVAGFQNSHVHFMGPGFDNAATRPAPDLERSVESMLTRYGVTTAFDTGSDQPNTLTIRTRIEKGELRGPRILTVGWPIYPPDGIPSYISHLPKHVLDGLHQPKSAADATADVRANIDAGADGIKIFMVTSPRQDVMRELSPDVARAIGVETHQRGKLLLAHPTSVAGIRNALQAGVDVLVHTTLGDPTPWDPALIRQMLAKKMSVIPTFKLWYYELIKDGAPPPVIDRLVNDTLEQLKAFNAAGGQVLFGTDVGYMSDFDPTDEYVLMSRAGLSAMDILASLTTAPAARWKESARRGRVAPGLDADLVVLAADPADDVRNFSNVRCVFRAGKLIYEAPKEAPKKE
jgi:imidazolonepropionase-like amidohydrolase